MYVVGFEHKQHAEKKILKANDLFKVQGKSALLDMLKPKSAMQKYISFS